MQSAEQEKLFGDWVENHQGLIFRVVHATAIDSEDKADLFQEILLQLWVSITSFQGRCKESTWIYRVALNTARAWKRKESRRRSRNQQIAEFGEWNHSDSEANPLLEKLYEAIRAMPRAEGSLLLLHLDGLSYKDISEVLGITENCVGVRLNRARQLLAKTMKQKD